MKTYAPDQQIRSIIVGMGGVTRSMLRSLNAKPWHEIAAVVDISPDALARAADDYALPQSALFSDLDAALQAASADVALINTPSELHFAQAAAALKAGISPLVAKPLTNRYSDSVALVNMAREKNLRLCVGQQMRYFRHYQVVAEFVATGALGSIEQVFFLQCQAAPSSAQSGGIRAARALGNDLPPPGLPGRPRCPICSRKRLSAMALCQVGRSMTAPA